MDRLFHVVVRFALAVILFSNITFRPVFLPVASSEEIQGGLGPFNASLLDETGVPEISPLFFLADASFLLETPAWSASFPPWTSDCRSSDDCLSYVLPGGLSRVRPLPQDDSVGDTYVVEGAHGLHLEFLPPYLLNAISYDRANCRIYGVNIFGIAICLENIGTSLNIGLS